MSPLPLTQGGAWNLYLLETDGMSSCAMFPSVCVVCSIASCNMVPLVQYLCCAICSM
jgi:hypothetical protein